MRVVLLEQTGFPTSLPESGVAAYVKEVAAARAERNALFDALASSVAAGEQDQALALQGLICASPAVHRCALLDAAKKLPIHRRPSLEFCSAKASHVSFDKQLSETVMVYAKAKSTGGWRPLVDPGPLRRARYGIVQAVLAPYLKPRTFQYGHRGVHRAIAAARQAIGEGYAFSARLDIEAYFQGFELDALLTMLPLRKELTEVVHARQMRKFLKIAPGTGPHPAHQVSGQDTLLEQARRGIPQGASCSPMVAALSTSRLAWSAMPGVRLLNYVDDFLLLAITQGELMAGIEGLTKAIGNLPGGTFHLKAVVQGHVQQGIEFLGHRLILDEGGVEAEVALGPINRFAQRLMTIETELNALGFPPGQTKQKDRIVRLLARELGFAHGWRAAFREARNVDQYVIVALNDVEAGAESLGCTLQDLKQLDEYAGAYGRYVYAG